MEKMKKIEEIYEQIYFFVFGALLSIGAGNLLEAAWTLGDYKLVIVAIVFAVGAYLAFSAGLGDFYEDEEEESEEEEN